MHLLKRLYILSGVIALLFAFAARAQVCTGSLGAPVVNETFGAGINESGPPLSTSITNYRYFAPVCGLEDGQYVITQKIASSSCKGGTWQVVQNDHTGDKNGYFMVVNASVDPGLFYTQRVDGSKLCPGNTYEFAAWIMNILRENIPQTQGYSRPNITFRIETVSGTLIKEYNTGDIASTIDPKFYKYGTFFTSPTDGSDLVIKMFNNGRGGNGNDLAMDDITVSPCGPVIQTGFINVTDSVTRKFCAGDNFAYTLAATQTGYTSPSFQWQQNFNNQGWVNITGATSATVNVASSNSAAGKYQYRVGVLSSTRAGAENCRIYSDPLTVIVFPYPKVTLAALTVICSGQQLQLSSSANYVGSYEWTGPRGFNATGDSPVITQLTDASFNGEKYTVKFMANGCATFATTTINVVTAATVQPMANATICVGESVQLNAVAANATHYNWSPAAGLSDAHIASPIASPKETTTYTVEVYNDACNMVRPASQSLITVLKPPVADAGGGLRFFAGQGGQLSAKIAGDSIVRTYWTPALFLDNPESLTPITTATGDITYTFHAVSATCGEATDTAFVRVYKKLLVNNSFSPNGDGSNDTWLIPNLSTYPKSVITVYNRLGSKVYQSRGYTTPWDGLYSGSTLPAGTYYYVIDPHEDNLPRTTGWVFIVR